MIKSGLGGENGHGLFIIPYCQLSGEKERNHKTHYLRHLDCSFNLKNEYIFNPLNAELNPIRHLLALVGAHHFVHVRRIRVNTV
jgi:hypothetical protein